MNNAFIYTYPIGAVGIAEENGAISRIFFGNKALPAGFTLSETLLIARAAKQFSEYFAGKRMTFDLPLNLRGTDFQLSVWKALQTIPPGETRSYKDVAGMVGNSNACRAVGLANNRNPIAIIIPCHRVVGSDGSLTGYAGGLDAKQYLLDLEKRHV